MTPIWAANYLQWAGAFCRMDWNSFLHSTWPRLHTTIRERGSIGLDGKSTLNHRKQRHIFTYHLFVYLSFWGEKKHSLIDLLNEVVSLRFIVSHTSIHCEPISIHLAILEYLWICWEEVSDLNWAELNWLWVEFWFDLLRVTIYKNTTTWKFVSNFNTGDLFLSTSISTSTSTCLSTMPQQSKQQAEEKGESSSVSGSKTPAHEAASKEEEYSSPHLHTKPPSGSSTSPQRRNWQASARHPSRSASAREELFSPTVYAKVSAYFSFYVRSSVDLG